MTLAGLLTIRNGNALDYNWRECGLSLLEVCDELVINDISSDDGTSGEIIEWAIRESRITLVKSEWTDPKGTIDWWPEMLNRTRQHAKSEMVIHLDADEVLHEKDYPRIRSASEGRQTLFCHRYNFWRDPQHLIPEGVCCGTKVLRIAPANMPIPSDYPYGPAEATMLQAVDSDIGIYHYGFLRKRDAFFKKARAVQRIWAGGYDPRLEAAEKFDGNWMTDPNVVPWNKDLTHFDGSHPAVIHKWLEERGYTC